MTGVETGVMRVAHELVDHRAAAHIRTRDELDAEVARIRASMAVTEIEADWPRRTSVTVETVLLRALDAPPNDVDISGDGEFAPVALPVASVDAYLHLRARIDPVDHPDAAHAVLRLRRADYEATVHLDGVQVATHTGYIGPIDVAYDATAAHQVDIIIRRARDAYRWSGESEGVNLGDAHGKGLGSRVDDAVTAGAGLAGLTVELRPSVRLDDVIVRGAASGEITVDLSTFDAPAGARASVTLSDADGIALWRDSADATAGSIRVSGKVEGIRPWSPADPTLYRVDVRLEVGGDVVDERVLPVGFRTVERLPDGSLTFNRAPLTLRGTTTIGCMWEEAARGDDEAIIAQLLAVRALFGNVLRVHVAVADSRLYDLADRYGVLIYQDGPYQWHCFEPRRDELDAELDQVIELSRHLQNHPSVVVASVPNEMHMKDPFHDSDIEFVTRAAGILAERLPDVIHLQDWSGGTRPKVLPQAVHDYPGYFYATTGARTGVLDDAANEQLDPDVRVIVSEYGGGAVPSWEAMVATQQAHLARGESISLPADASGRWSSEASLYEPTGEMIRMHQRVVGWRGSFDEYRDASGAAQARVLRRQTGRLRRDRARVTGVIHHYLQNPGHLMYNPWVDLHVIDNAGELTGGFDALRDALRPIGLEVLGLPARTYAERPLQADVWIYNDLAEETPVQISWTWEVEGRTIESRDAGLIAPADDSVLALSVQVAAPTVTAPTTATLRCVVSVGGRRWVSSEDAVTVLPPEQVRPGAVQVLGDLEALSARAGTWLPDLAPMSDDSTAPVIVTPDVPLAPDTIARLDAAVQACRTVILLERQPGDDLSWVSRGIVSAVTREQPVEVANVELSLSDTGLTTDDLSRWATEDGRVLSHPLMGIDRRGTTAWARCGHGLQLMALQESARGGGLVLVCQLLVWTTLEQEPNAARVLRAMLDAVYRPI